MTATDLDEGGVADMLAACPAPVLRVAVIGDAGLAAALAVARRDGAAVDLIDLDRTGAFPATASPWVAPGRTALIAGGVPPDRIRVVAEGADMRPADLLLALEGFGDRWKIRHLPPLLPGLLAPGGRLILDIRKGSGAFPLLRPLGPLTALATRADAGTPVVRTLLTLPAAPEEEPWAVIARRLAGPRGFYREGGEHAFLFVPRDDTLVVTFDNLDLAMTKRDDRRPWGFSFIERQGWSMLGVTATGWTWFRDPWVIAEFARLRDEGFFAEFRRVVFYGASMGAYAACAFADACPGADVVAISPQTTLDRRVVPWETRYATAWGRDFSGPTGDAATASLGARRVVLMYDPYEPLDAAHAARFTGANVMRLRAPLMGHRLGSSLQQMGILGAVTVGALDGTLTEAAYYAMLRARKTFPRYQRELFDRAVARGHVTLARKMARWVLTRGDNRAIRKRLRDL